MAGTVKISDENYPELLKNTPHPPKTFYYKGKYRSEIFNNCVAVVGSRKMSFYGEKVIEKLFSDFSKDITVVSGFMTGVDAESHRQALKHGLKTIAVMPCGIEYVHPEDQSALYEEIIASGGLILSEFEGDFKPQSWTYPKRNRIVAGLSRAVVVIEASMDSGSLITARIANSYSRKVFVVPGSIFSSLSLGKIQISNEFATSIDSGFIINKFLGLDFKSVMKNNDRRCENRIVKILQNGPLTLDEISKQLSLDIPTLSTEITVLSISDLVSERGGKYYAC